MSSLDNPTVNSLCRKINFWYFWTSSQVTFIQKI